MLNKKLFVGISLIGLAALLLIATAEAQNARSISFEQHIKPILENHCINCHGPKKEEGTRLDIRDDALDYIEIGDPENSDLYIHLISDDEEELMPPPEEENALTAEQIALVKTWIIEGAEWPDEIEVVDAQIGKKPADANADNESADEPDTDPQTNNPSRDQPEKAADKPLKPAAAAGNTMLKNAIGSLHPAIVHIPIGLLLGAGLFALFSIRGNFVMSDCAYYCLWLGTIGACLACVSGWFYCALEHRDTVTQLSDLLDQKQDIFWHRSSALVCTAFAVLLCLFAAGARARDPDDGVMWKLGLMVLAVGICITGHNGGELTHGKNLYKDLSGILETIIPSELFGGGKADVPAPDKTTPDKTAPDKTAPDKTGATSEEIK